MNPWSLALLKSTVLILGILAVSLGAAVYLLMELVHRRKIGRDVRRTILTSNLFPIPKAGELGAIWKASGPRDREVLGEILADLVLRTEGQQRETIEHSVVGSGILDCWIHELRGGSISARARAARYLGGLRDLRSVIALTQATEDPSTQVCVSVALALGRLGDSRGLTGLLRLVDRPAAVIPDLTVAAALASCAKDCPIRLIKLLEHPRVRGRIVGAWAISEVADKSVLRYLLLGARDPEPEVRAKVARALGRIAGQESVVALSTLARDPTWFVRVRALDALGRLRDPLAKATVLRGLNDPMREVCYRAAFALRRIEGMKPEVATQVLATLPRLSFVSLISEWDRAGFLWEVVSGLVPSDKGGFEEKSKLISPMVRAGFSSALVYFVLVFPNIKIRLRLLRLIWPAADEATRAKVRALAERPNCDRRVAGWIKRASSATLRVSKAGKVGA